MNKIDASSSSFWAATQDNDQATGLGVLERQRVKAWLQTAYAALATVAP